MEDLRVYYLKFLIIYFRLIKTLVIHIHYYQKNLKNQIKYADDQLILFNLEEYSK